jgi:hypothetical protein
LLFGHCHHFVVILRHNTSTFRAKGRIQYLLKL